jgi:hypothetical protein
MKFLKELFLCVLFLSLTALFLSLMVLVRDADTTVRLVPAEITATRSALTAEIQATRRDLLATVNTQATAIQRTADRRLGSIQQMVDARTAQALQIADSRLSGATDQVAALRQDLHPVLANAAALTKDTQDSLDDLYPDIKASTESATVAITSAAHASEAVRDAAPKVAESVVKIGNSADGVAADVKREADSIVAPKKWWQKALGPVYIVARLVALFL